MSDKFYYNTAIYSVPSCGIVMILNQISMWRQLWWTCFLYYYFRSPFLGLEWWGRFNFTVSWLWCAYEGRDNYVFAYLPWSYPPPLLLYLASKVLDLFTIAVFLVFSSSSSSWLLLHLDHHSLRYMAVWPRLLGISLVGEYSKVILVRTFLERISNHGIRTA